ncbi:hypothetical protein [Streptomyces sp. NPDC046925]|uniref:hypothetical protein n=1 Tax=Streptomyces sp. NPDC046925 TaxID=3155375 RepID=UPI0033DB625A
MMLALGLLLVGLPAACFLTSYGCGEEEDRLAEALAGEAVLDSVPEGADREDRYRECDDDDRFVVVGTRYRHGDSADGVLRHYEAAASAAGWRPRAAKGGNTVPGCFTKPVGGTTAYLTVEGPDDGRLHVEIIADRAGSPWC